MNGKTRKTMRMSDWIFKMPRDPKSDWFVEFSVFMCGGTATIGFVSFTLAQPGLSKKMPNLN